MITKGLITIRKAFIVAALSVFGFTSEQVFAEGTLDFLDPCIAAGNKFDSSAAAMRSNAAAVEAKWSDINNPPQELRSLYVEAIREAFYKKWSELPAAKDQLVKLKTKTPDLDEKKYFIENIYPMVITPDSEGKMVLELYKSDYEKNIQPQISQARVELEKTIGEGKQTYDESCKPDVVNQAIRATFGNLAIAINSNVEGAKREDGDIAKAIRAISGISIADIGTKGLFGGDNSVINQSLKVINKGVYIKVDSPPPIKVGGVCIPWC